MTDTHNDILKTVLAISTMTVSIIGYNFWPYCDCFYVCLAFTIFLAAFLLVVECPAGNIRKRIYYIFLFLAFNNLLDEIFFDPKSFGLNEYFIAAFIIAHQMYIQRKSGNARCEP